MSRGAVAGVLFLGLLLVPLGVLANGIPPDPSPPSVDPEEFLRNTKWGLDLRELSRPDWAPAGSFSQIHVSPSGEVLVVGLDNGGILFLEADTGQRIASAYTDEHGAVRSIQTDYEGRRAVFVYEDGYVAAVDSSQESLLMSRFSETGAPPGVRSQVGAALSLDGRTLVVSAGDLELYRLQGEAPDSVFERLETSEDFAGRHILLHPVLPFLAVLDDAGRIGVLDESLVLQHPPVRVVDGVAAVAASHDGRAVAVVQPDGRLLRYEARLTGGEPELVLRYEQALRCTVPTCRGTFGVALDTDGSRVVAWTNQQVLWAEGDNRNVASSEARRTDQADTVRLTHPVDGAWVFGQVAVDRELTRVLVTQVETGGVASAHHYSMPSASASDAHLGGRSDPAGLALAPLEGRAFVTQGPLLGAFSVAPSPAVGGAFAEQGEPGAWSSLWGWLLGALLLAVFVVGGLFVASLMVTRRGEDSRLIAALELDEGPLAPPASARPSLPGGGARGMVRSVPLSAPPEAPPPEGLLVLEGFSVPGRPALKDLRVSFARPGVVRLAGRRVLLERLLAGLQGQAPSAGVASVGGVDRRMTPLLFSHHLRVGLDAPDRSGRSAREWYDEQARMRGVPSAVASRRLQVDLGWMGGRLDRPFVELGEVDQWKVRLAVAFLDRPRVVVLWTDDVPARTDEERAMVRRVLHAVGRHYRTVVLLLDPEERIPASVVREWAHEEVRLTRDGFVDRALLDDGRLVAPPRAPFQAGAPAAGENGARTKRASGPKRALGRRATRSK